MLRKLCVTENGTMIVGNVWICKSSMGLPMDVIFDALKQNNAMPHWPQFIHQALKEGMSPEKLYSETKTAVIDVWGKDAWIALNRWLALTKGEDWNV